MCYNHTVTQEWLTGLKVLGPVLAQRPVNCWQPYMRPTSKQGCAQPWTYSRVHCSICW